MKGFTIKITQNKVDARSFMTKDYDNSFVDNDTYGFLLEGVLLNREKLLKQYALKDFSTLIGELYRKRGELMTKELEGEIRGFIWDKMNSKVFVFTNPTNTQNVFYATFNDTIYVDTNLIRLNETLKESGIRTQPDMESLYQFLCFSNLPERKTPISGISKLLDGQYLEIDCLTNTYQEKEYFSLKGIPYFSGSKNAAIDQVHEVFRESVLMEYEKDTELGKNHLSLLSGGLDSRVAMMYAIKNQEKPGNVLCFSQSGYPDHTISEKIAQDYQLHYEFIPLNDGKFLTKIDELTRISEGMVFYTGGIHVKYAVEKMQYENFALFHSGQIGDGVLGGFNSEPKRKKPTRFKMVVNPQFLPKVSASLDEILDDYETEELFLLRNIAYNRTLLGAHVFQEKRYQTSPFMSKDFLKTAISLPEEWKFNHRFYLEWIKKHCPESTKYKWERTLMKPDAQWKTTFGDKFMKRGFKALYEKILKTPQHSSMYPYQYYYDNDPEIQRVYQNYFDENIGRIDGYEELSKDVRTLFESKYFAEKSQAVNILAIFKLFF